MKQIKLLTLLAIILWLPTLAVTQKVGDDNGQGAQGTNSGQVDQNNGPANGQNHSTGDSSNPPSGGHDESKWRTSATEIDTLGVLGASLILASVYFIRRRNKTRL